MSEIFDWARPERLQPEPITVEIWRRLPEEFCRMVEVVDGQAIRCESPSRLHQKMARRLANILEAAAQRHTAQTDECLDADMDFDVVLWELPRAQIRRPDVALFRCAPEDHKPLPAHMVLLAVEVVSGAGRVDMVDKKAEYAAAAIPWYWIVRLNDSGVDSIEVLALDHGIGGYRSIQVLRPEERSSEARGPLLVSLPWEELTI